MGSLAYRVPRPVPVATMLALLASAVALGLVTRETVERAPAASASPLEAEIAELPLSFERLGRGSGEYLARSVSGGTLVLSAGDAALSFPGARSPTLTLELVGARPHPKPSVSAPSSGRVNRFIGDDPDRWRTGIATHERVGFAGVYPGIDIDYYGNQRNLEYDFRLAAGADPNRIAIELGGADAVRVNSAGGLAIDAGSHRIHQLAPVAYQTVAGERVAVPARFAVDGDTVGFALGDYDRSRPLVIDPVVVSFSTFVGGNTSSDPLRDVFIDPNGDIFVAGQSSGSAFAPIAEGFQNYGGGFSDGVVMKLDVAPGGAVSLAYSTYLGGSDTDDINSIAADAAGAAYVTGITNSTNFPAQDALPGGDPPQTDVFVAKLNPDGGGAVSLAYSTYLGGSGPETGRAIAVDAAGAAYVGAETGSTDFPTQDPLTLGIGLDQPGFDATITKLAPDSGGAVTLAYSTYMGSDAADGVNGIAVTPDGTTFATGTAHGAGFPLMGQFQTDQGGIDGFVVKLDPGGAADLDYSSYMGGGGLDSPEAIAVDSVGTAYVVGDTESTDFPTVRAFQTDQAGSDIFVTKVNPGGSATIGYSTYLGGAGFDGLPDESEGIDVDAAGGVYVTGSTTSTDFPTADAFDVTLGGTGDAFATRIAPDTGGAVELSLSSYFGGGGSDVGTAIAATADGFWLTGTTNSADLPIVDPLPGTSLVGQDAFVSRFGPAPPAPPPEADTTPPETTIVSGPRKRVKKRKARFAFESSEPGSTFECALDKKPFAACSTPAKFKVKRKPRKHTLRVRAIDPAGNVDQTPAERRWKLKRKRR